MSYDLSSVYEAFEQLGQASVSISYNDRFNISLLEIENACTSVALQDVINILDTITSEQPLKELRAKRNALLSETDWVVTKSIEEGSEMPEEWKTYRQDLRDITHKYTNIDDVIWPEKP